MNIRSVINAIEDFAPRALQESYDNAGLQAGDATNICTGVLLTLDVNENTVTEAKEYHFAPSPSLQRNKIHLSRHSYGTHPD